MAEPPLDTVMLNGCLDRMQAGDKSAQQELLKSAGHRLEKLARKMIQRFPDVRRWAETEDVLQNAQLRLLKALQAVRPTSTREFFGLAAEQMRRELLDLARHFNGPLGEGANHESVYQEGGSTTGHVEPPDSAPEREADLDQWASFHQEVDNLPAEEREVVGLVFYHGWTQAQVAELFQITERTVRRRWESALEKLRSALGESQHG